MQADPILNIMVVACRKVLEFDHHLYKIILDSGITCAIFNISIPLETSKDKLFAYINL